jgi:hypothetical protein
MLDLRPNCECCNRDLPAEKLAKYPASTKRIFKPEGCAPKAGA